VDKLLHLSSIYFPAHNTQAAKLLCLLADGLPHPKQELLKVLEDDPRSALQTLRGEGNQFWLIHNLGDTKGIYQLDDRHLSGDITLDQHARNQAEINYWQRSKTKSERGARNLEAANRKLKEAKAKADLQQAFDFPSTQVSDR